MAEAVYLNGKLPLGCKRVVMLRDACGRCGDRDSGGPLYRLHYVYDNHTQLSPRYCEECAREVLRDMEIKP